MRDAPATARGRSSSTRRWCCRRGARALWTRRPPGAGLQPHGGAGASSRLGNAGRPGGHEHALGIPVRTDLPTGVEDHRRRDHDLRRGEGGGALPPGQLPVQRAAAERRPALDAFLFEDKIGYCQQFSGAMALMLRLQGIPARVAAGFSPGSYNRDSGEYRVRDLDAHSWVEVWFNGIGWVPFDPTPAASPAESQSSGLEAVSAAGGGAGEVRSRSQSDALSERAGARPGPPRTPVRPVVRGGRSRSCWSVAAARMRPGGPSARGGGERVRHGGGPAGRAALRARAPRLRAPASTTLLALERRLARSVGPVSARYVAALRAHRYDPAAPDAPRLSERRALRRELTARGGLRGRLRGMRAIPPAGPRPL